MNSIGAVRTPVALLTLLVLAGCAVGPDYREAPPAVPAAWSVSETDHAAGPTAWWTAFNDPLLEALVSRARTRNFDLRLAQARLREVRANYGIEQSAFGPKVDAGAGVTRRATSAGSPTGATLGNSWQAGFDASWELDVFGGTRRAVEAAGAEVERAELAVGDAQVSLTAETVLAYLSLRAAQERIAALQQVIDAQAKLVDLVSRRTTAGLADRSDQAAAEADLAATRARAPAFLVDLSQAINRLAVLVGDLPPTATLTEDNPLAAPDLRSGGKLPDPTTSLAPGLPSELLRRRPDLRRAERAVAAATARVGVAKADYFPKFSLTGSFGWTNDTPGGLFTAANSGWAIGPAVRWPILSSGRIRNQVAAADARLEQAGISYEQAVVLAATEVENALVRTARGRERVQAAAQALQARQESASLAARRLERGLVDVSSTLEQERLLGEARSNLVDARFEQGAALAALAKALGGGWEPVTKP